MKPLLWAILASTVLLPACSSVKTLYKKDTFSKIIAIDNGAGDTYIRVTATVEERTKADITEKTDYVIITPKTESYLKLDSAELKAKDITDLELQRLGKYYYPYKDEKKSLKYFDIKFGLQALTIPLKFRKAVGDGVTNPKGIETGVNVGFAPGWKFTHNIYKDSKNYLGKNTTQVALAIGPHLGFGTTDLKKASNAPGVLSDRKAASFTFGGYALFGFNNINLGFAVGKDNLLGQKEAQWVYKKQWWTGVIVSLDILKY